MRKKLDNPCYVDGVDCPDRKAACQLTCAKWQAYVKIRDAQYTARKRDADYIMEGYLYDLKNRIYRRLRSGKKKEE